MEITTEAIEAAKEVAMVENAMEATVAVVVKVAFMGAEEVAMVENKVITRDPIALVYRIEVQAHLIILNRNICRFLFWSACLLTLRIFPPPAHF